MAQQDSINERVIQHIATMDAQAEKVRVPEFKKGLDWLNSPPLRFDHELKGKLVVLDFWTYCCINCIHVIPELKILEEKYKNRPVAFIGVHSPKFTNEKVSDNIRQAVLRYEIEHPVVNDPEMTLWRSLGVNSWPTLVVLGPEGNVLYVARGEGKGGEIDKVLEGALTYYDTRLDFNPLPIALEQDVSPSPLSFPGKLAIDQKNGRLFISDSNNNRIIVTDLNGKHLDTIGSGLVGLADGPCCNASFDRPQGLAYHNDTLYIADTENHALRVVDLKAKQVTTIAGNGSQGHDYRGGSTGADQPLSSPWDVLVNDNTVYIAMAGTHQIWKYDHTTGKVHNFAGSGRELNLNSDDLLQTGWAQPSGLATGGSELFIADSESSSIRAIDLNTGASRTLAGGDGVEPRNLFAYGDKDGAGDGASLQHPLGVLWIENEKSLLIADTYNHKIKKLDPQTNIVKTLAGTGTPGNKDGSFKEASFYEPSGMVLHPDGDKVYIADSNNHSIRLLDFIKETVSTLSLNNIPLPKEPEKTKSLVNHEFAIKLSAEELVAEPNREGKILLKINLPENHHLTEGAPSRWQIRKEPNMPIAVDPQSCQGAVSEGTTIEIPYTSTGGTGEISLEAIIFYCKDGKACLMEELLTTISFNKSAGGSSNTTIEHTAKPFRENNASPKQ